MSSIKPNLLLISTLLLLVAACEATKPPFRIDNEKYGDVVDRKADSPGVLISKRANDVYELQYFVARANKAFAQSRNGNWGWTQGKNTIEAAMDDALKRCQDNNEAYEDKKPCEIVNVNGYWIGEFSRRSR